MYKLVVISILLLISSTVGKKSCDYSVCPQAKQDAINVHLVPYTEVDLARLKTFDQYFYGSKNSIEKASYHLILDSVIDQLLQDKKRRFIINECAIFFKWWEQQPLNRQSDVKVLINENRLEFVGGGWSVNDESIAHYQSIIDQHTFSIRKLQQTFGECGRPKIGWQVGPYGHSKEMASIYARFGYDGLFIQNVNQYEYQIMAKKQELEFMWQGSNSLGSNANIFTSIINNNFQLCFDILCSDDPIIDNRNSAEFNLNIKMGAFISHIKKLITMYRSNHILIPIGGTFNYMAAQKNFNSIDKLIKYANEYSQLKLNVFYSTPSCYMKSLSETKVDWPYKSNDFIPFVTASPSAYFTGGYASRSSLKRSERLGNQLLQICKQLSVTTAPKEFTRDGPLTELMDQMGVMQHHEILTGAIRQHVSNDLMKQLGSAMSSCAKLITEALNKLSRNSNTAKKLDFLTCPGLNVSSCAISNSDRIIVTLMNSMASEGFQYIRFPVRGNNYIVKDADNNIIKSTFVPINDEIKQLPTFNSLATHEIAFTAEGIPASGFKSFYVEKTQISSNIPVLTPNNQEFTIKNNYMNITFNKHGIIRLVEGNGAKLVGSQYFSTCLSEPRVPYGFAADHLIMNCKMGKTYAKATVKVYKNDLFEEVHQVFTPWLSQITRVYINKNVIDLQPIVGPINTNDGMGRDVFMVWDTDMKENTKCRTDSNGREFIYRPFSRKPTGYPISTQVQITDGIKQMTLLSDRGQYADCSKPGLLMLNLHRRLTSKNKIHLNEVLDEVEYNRGVSVRPIVYFNFGTIATTLATTRFISIKKLVPALVYFSSANDIPYNTWRTNYRNYFAAFNGTFPLNAHMLTMEPWDKDKILFRFEHIFEKDEHPVFSTEYSFDLREKFPSIRMVRIVETTLDGNKPIADDDRISFYTPTKIVHGSTNPFLITLKPMEIRTFIVTVKM